MRTLTLDLRTFDVGVSFPSAADLARHVVGLVRESWDEGADLVALPELTWMALERYVHGPDKLRQVAALFQDQIWPMLREGLATADRAVLLGSAPCLERDGRLVNRAAVLCGQTVIHQDKLHLTPWEGEFTGGSSLRIWHFRGIRAAVVICLDVEIPEISAALRGRNVDLLLVPSATESILGVERVNRCASARAVELGCHVAVCPLVGRMESDLIDVNIGRLAVYSPSQSPFLDASRSTCSAVVERGFHRLSATLSMDSLHAPPTDDAETDPARVCPHPILVTES